MSACGDFWFWFTRIFAEFLGGVALLACIVGPIGLLALFLNWGVKKPRIEHEQD